MAAAGLASSHGATAARLQGDRPLVYPRPLVLAGGDAGHARVVRDRNRITGGGVTAGIDFGLTLASLLRSREEAEWVQLVIEYAPAPPFNAGLPESAPRAVYERLMRARSPALSAAREKASRIGAKLRS